MKWPSAAELLSLWEKGFELSLLRRTLLLLELLDPALGHEGAAQLSIAERDKLLFRMRRWMFGPDFRSIIDCPKCAGRMEWEMHMDQLLEVSPVYPENPGEYELDVENYKIRFRLPNSQDMMEILADKNKPVGDPDFLINKCIVGIQLKNRNQRSKKLPVKIQNALQSEIEKLSSAADIRMSITCHSCGYQWEAVFDIMRYLWAEIDNWAHRMIRDVYTLASVFGWSEKEILNMDAARRQIYAEMIRS
jgi:hypothetical protein